MSAPVQQYPLSSSDSDATAQYIFEMTVSLRRMAAGAGLDLLAHILDMASEEAEERCRRDREFKGRRVKAG